MRLLVDTFFGEQTVAGFSVLDVRLAFLSIIVYIIVPSRKDNDEIKK